MFQGIEALTQLPSCLLVFAPSGPQGNRIESVDRESVRSGELIAIEHICLVRKSSSSPSKQRLYRGLLSLAVVFSRRGCVLTRQSATPFGRFCSRLFSRSHGVCKMFKPAFGSKGRFSAFCFAPASSLDSPSRVFEHMGVTRTEVTVRGTTVLDTAAGHAAWAPIEADEFLSVWDVRVHEAGTSMGPRRRAKFTSSKRCWMAVPTRTFTSCGRGIVRLLR